MALYIVILKRRLNFGLDTKIRQTFALKNRIGNMKTVTVQIHDKYALTLLEDLQKVNVLTIVKNTEPELVIPDWQQKMVLQRMEDARKNPGLLHDWEDVKHSI